MSKPFRDRTEAGRVLAEKLKAYANRPDVAVLALPRGGVPVAYEVARSLNAPLDIFLARKLGVPGHAELAMADAGACVKRWSWLIELRVDRVYLRLRLGQAHARFESRKHRQ